MNELKLMLEYTKKLNVLYVEDDRALVEATKELLENFFLSLDIAYDGESGLEQYEVFKKENNSFYDLVITDINMPKMNGIAMSTNILKICSKQSIIITSAHNEVEYLSSAIDLGIEGFVAKPINNKKLMKVLHKVAEAIGDHKFVEAHVAAIEDLSISLAEQNRELTSKNAALEKSLRILDTMVHKEQLSKLNSELDKKDVKAEPIDERMEEQIHYLIENDLPELREIHEEIDIYIIESINNIDSVDIQSVEYLVEKFRRYSLVLSFHNFFDELSHSMKNLSQTINDNTLPENRESIKNIFMILESFMYVLGKWQDDLIYGDEKSINLLDASMISDMNTISNLWMQKNETVSDEELDSVFDF